MHERCLLTVGIWGESDIWTLHPVGARSMRLKRLQARQCQQIKFVQIHINDAMMNGVKTRTIRTHLCNDRLLFIDSRIYEPC